MFLFLSLFFLQKEILNPTKKKKGKRLGPAQHI